MTKFKIKESYMHRYAKQVLKEWLLQDEKVVNIKVEQPFYKDDGVLSFVPDLTVYDKNGLWCFFEVYHKHEIEGRKILEMQKYCYINKLQVNLIEISAYWILSQFQRPNELKGILIKLY